MRKLRTKKCVRVCFEGGCKNIHHTCSLYLLNPTSSNACMDVITGLTRDSKFGTVNFELGLSAVMGTSKACIMSMSSPIKDTDKKMWR